MTGGYKTERNGKEVQQILERVLNEKLIEFEMHPSDVGLQQNSFTQKIRAGIEWLAENNKASKWYTIWEQYTIHQEGSNTVRVRLNPDGRVKRGPNKDMLGSVTLDPIDRLNEGAEGLQKELDAGEFSAMELDTQATLEGLGMFIEEGEPGDFTELVLVSDMFLEQVRLLCKDSTKINVSVTTEGKIRIDLVKSV